MKYFSLLGAAGYIAPRHMKAIRDVGGELSSAYDPVDNVGVIDSYFPNCDFHNNFEQYLQAFADAQEMGLEPDYVSICSPNHFHRPHIAFALRNEVNAICEKPLVLSEEDLDYLEALERKSNAKINTILQLRLHPEIVKLKKRISLDNRASKYEVDLSYFTSRGPWYKRSWKSEDIKSGGIVSNIGIHFFDMLIYLFGDMQSLEVHSRSNEMVAGFLELKNARVRWVLSIDQSYLPKETPAGQSTFRSITIDSEEVEFSKGFTELHTKSYQEIIAGRGFSLATARPSVSLACRVNSVAVSERSEFKHPLTLGFE